MSDLDGEMSLVTDGDGTPAPPPSRRLPAEMSGEYRDPVNYWMLATGVGIGGIFLWIYIEAGAFRNPAVGAFASIFPLLCQLVTYAALNVATLGYDQSGWRYRREIFGHTLETEEGRWSDVYQTGYRQWALSGRGGMSMFGEFSLLDAKGRAVIKARTCFYPPSGSKGNHAASRRLIGLSEEDFWSFVRLINDETPQLAYEFAQDLEHAQPPRNRFFYADAGPARYVPVPRGTRISDTGASETRASDPLNLPTPF
jgi:hypothetical protein